MGQLQEEVGELRESRKRERRESQNCSIRESGNRGVIYE